MQTAEAATDDSDEHDAEDSAHGIIRDGRQLKDHLIIIGFGIGGQIMAHGAKSCGIPYIISEMNPDTVEKYRATEPIRHGDASFPLVLGTSRRVHGQGARHSHVRSGGAAAPSSPTPAP